MRKQSKNTKPTKKEKIKKRVKQKIPKFPKKDEIEIKVTPEQVEKERKTLAIIMAISGAIIWMITPTVNIEGYIVKAIGMIIFIFGLSNIYKYKPISKKRVLIVLGLVLALLAVFVFIGILVLVK